MKIEQKIILSNTINVALIVLIGIFAFQNLNNVLTKLRFMEIADELNASFLEMRLSEKNYFLYRDSAALGEIQEKIASASLRINASRADIIRAIGGHDLKELENYLGVYASTVREIQEEQSTGPQAAAKLRATGKKLKEFSEEITKTEQKRVNEIITGSKKILAYSFFAVLFLAGGISHIISQKILHSLRKIEQLAKSISQGNFHRIEDTRPNDEMGALIDAINAMSEELGHREDQLIQSKKLASLGILTAGVAHELTNPLNNISMIAQTYAEVYDRLDKDQRIDFMGKIDSETERIREIVKNLLDFSKPQKADQRPADINSAVRDSVRLMQNTLDISNIDLNMSLSSHLPPVFVDRHQIQQVLINLITNAVQAMAPGGGLFIGTRSGKEPGFIEVTIKDSGKGIPPEYVPHIFDPFFSTKGEGGTGLGLSVSYGIVRNHGGDIRVESKVGVGTTFSIELPIYHRKEQTDEHHT
ncbi:MAG: HAMP domain-containing protein [Nitrospirae bacterium]|nr:HAMP domain-containing protein [Nitrospirota bacterium]